jgi:hypothetical protein
MLEDSQIEERVGGLISGMTEKFEFHKKPTNCQRAIWFNSGGVTNTGVLEVRNNDLQRRAVRLAATKLAAERKLKRIEDLANKERALGQIATGQMPFKVNRLYACECSNDCTAIPHLRTIIIGDDGWRGCPTDTCSHFYCAKLNCQKKLGSHLKLCLQRRR